MTLTLFNKILLGERAHLIEFPSILLPPGATTGSIVNIAVHQNSSEEKRRDNEFWALQNEILEKYGVTSPENPKLEVRPYYFPAQVKWKLIDSVSSCATSLKLP